MNENDVMEMAQTVAGYLTGAAVSTGVHLGDRLGLYRSMAGAGLLAADDVADRTGCDRRLVREWLDGQASAGLVGYDAASDRYELSDEGAMVLADDTSPAFVARGAQGLGSLWMDIDKIESTYRGERTLDWGDHHQCLFDGTEWFFRPGYRAFLTAEWIPAIPGLADRLEAGASVLDVGCGHGASVALMAEAYPNSTFTGLDLHPESLAAARARVDEIGATDRCDFVAADAQSYEGDYDVICFFDCLHDMGDPVGAATHARSRLRPDGLVFMVEPFAFADRATNIAENPIAPLMYHGSAMICTPTSLSQPVGLGLGGQAGEQRLRDVMTQAGFSTFERRSETPFNVIFDARA